MIMRLNHRIEALVASSFIVARTIVQLSILLLLLLHVDVIVVVDARKTDRNVPHHHNGILKPYKPGPFQNIQLTKSDINQLETGHAVMKQIIPDDPNESGSVLCVQDVYAPLPAVWYQILDMDSYPKKVSKVNENKNYVVKRNPNGTCTIKTKQVLGVLPGYAYESYYDHTYYPSQSSLIWTLDYNKVSDFDDVSGHWHVVGLEPNKSRVYYACDIKMKGTVPGPILNYISKQALKQATAWVKRESEANPTKTIPSTYGGTPPLPKGTSFLASAMKKKNTTNEKSVGNSTPSRSFWGFWGLRSSKIVGTSSS